MIMPRVLGQFTGFVNQKTLDSLMTNDDISNLYFYECFSVKEKVPDYYAELLDGRLVRIYKFMPYWKKRILDFFR